MFCSKCAAKIPDGSIFCPECGQKLTANNAQQAPLRQQPLYTQPPVQQTRVSAPMQPAYDPQSAPLSTGNFFWMPVLIGIPVIGFIVLLVWAFSKDTNLNRKHYARAALIWLLISLILVVIVTIAGGGFLRSLQDAIGVS